MISIESLSQQQAVGPPSGVGSFQNLANVGVEHPGAIGKGISHELPTAYVTSTPLPLHKAEQQPCQQPQQLHQMHQIQQIQMTQQQQQHPPQQLMRMMSDEERKKAETEKNAIISSLFEEIRLEATLFGGSSSSLDIKKEAVGDDEDQPTALGASGAGAGAAQNKKLKKRKSELALEMTADDVDDILGDSTNSNFNPKNPFGGPSPSNGFDSPGSSSFNSSSQKSSPPLSKYSQNNQGHRNSPPVQGFPNMSPYMQTQMNSPLHPQLQQQNSLTSSPPVTMHSPAQVPEFKPTMMMNPLGGPLPHHPLHLPHHTRLLQHQQSAPNLRLGSYEEPQSHPLNGAARLFDRSLVEEFNMCVQAVLMASQRVYCRHVYRQLTAEVSELYARVAKNQVPKKAVKKIIAARTPATPGERNELERQFKCLSDGLESRQSPQLYESILNFLYKMRVAIPDVSS